MWVVDIDTSDQKVIGYNLATNTHDSSKDISLDASKTQWTYITSDGTTMWVAEDTTLTYLWAYNLSTGARESSKDFDLDTENDWAKGLWTDGVTMYVMDRYDRKIYAYTLATEARDDSKDISLHADNADIGAGLWSDGVTMWVTDSQDDKLYAYKMSDGSRDSAKDYNNLDSSNTGPYAGWSDGATMWVTEGADNAKRLYAYHSKAPVTLPPAAPTTVNAYRGKGFVDVEWPAVTGASGYNVQHYHPWNVLLQGQAWITVATNTTATGLQVSRNNWAGDVLCVQAVKRLNAQDFTSPWTCSDPVPQVTTYPTAPGALSASRIGSNEIAVGWNQCDVTQAS